jgi:hypothetical protein
MIARIILNKSFNNCKKLLAKQGRLRARSTLGPPEEPFGAIE